MNQLTDAGRLDRQNPWPGLLAFSEEAREFFNGRESERDELFRLIRREQLTLLYGHSGLGKTSLLNAGLFPLMRGENYLPVSVRIDHRAESPPAGEQMLRRLLEECRVRGIEAPEPAPGQTLWEFLHLKDTTFWSARNHPVTPVFIIDQFEEVFTLGRAVPQRSGDFLLHLGHLINNEIPGELQERLNADPEEAGRFSFRRTDYRLVLSLREDFLPELEHQLRDIVRAPTQNSVRLKRMTGQQAHDALLATGGHLLAPDVAQLIIRFLSSRVDGEADGEAPLADLEIEPALLSVFARELNERRKERGLDRIEAALLRGSKSEILSGFYESRFTGMDPAVRVFVEEELLTDSGYRDSSALEDAVRRPGVTLGAINSLINQRLLRREERFGTQRVELTHDVLTKIVRESRDERRRREAEAERTAREAAEKQRLRKRTRQLAAVAGVFVLLGLGSLVFGAYAMHASEQARQNLVRATLAREEAEEARAAEAGAVERAEAARRVAEMRAEEALRAEKEAEAARQEAAAERDNAESARRTAERERALSDRRATRLAQLLDRPEDLSDLRLSAGQAHAAELAKARHLTVGSEVTGRLAPGALAYADRPFALWLYQGRAGEIVQVDHSSDDYDAYLYLFDMTTGEMVAYNDDGPSMGLNSRIETRLPRSGIYVIVASTFAKNVQGDYTLILREGSEENLEVTAERSQPEALGDRPRSLTDAGLTPEAALARGAHLEMGVAQQAVLDASSPTVHGWAYGLWLYEGSAGEAIRIDHRSSEFDAYLYLFDGSTGDLIVSNDDGGSGVDSRIDLELPRSGTYIIVASSFGRGSQGAYEISVTESGAATDETPVGSGRPQRLTDLGIPPGIVPAAARPLLSNVISRGSLGPASAAFGGRRYEMWVFDGTEGQSIHIHQRSQEIDSYLYLFDLESGELIEANDDGPGGLDSLIELRLMRTTRYLVVASSFGRMEEGDYELHLHLASSLNHRDGGEQGQVAFRHAVGEPRRSARVRRSVVRPA